MEQERELVVGQDGKDNVKEFFWLVRSQEGKDLDPNTHLALTEKDDAPFLACKTEVLGLQIARNKEGKLGIIVYVIDKETPAVTGTVLYP